MFEYHSVYLFSESSFAPQSSLLPTFSNSLLDLLVGLECSEVRLVGIFPSVSVVLWLGFVRENFNLGKRLSISSHTAFFLGTAITCTVDEGESMLHLDIPYCAKDTATQWEEEIQNWLNWKQYPHISEFSA